MTALTHNRLVFTGFLLVYCATMGAVVAATSPLSESLRTEIELFVMLPAGLVGLILSRGAYAARVASAQKSLLS